MKIVKRVVIHKLRQVFLRCFDSDHDDLKRVHTISTIEWIQTLIYVAGVLILIGMSVKDFRQLLIEYQYNNVATQVEVIIDKNFTSPQLIVCIPHYKNENLAEEPLMAIARSIFNGSDYWDCPECQRLANRSWDVWNEPDFLRRNLTSLNQTYNFLTLALLRKLFAEDRSRTPSDQERELRGPVLTAAMNFLIWHDRMDYWHTFAKDLEANISLSKFIDGSDTWRRPQQLDDLAKRVMRALCKDITVTSWDYLSNDSWIKVETKKDCEYILTNSTTAPVTLDWSGLWFPLPTGRTARTRKFSFNVREHRDAPFWLPDPPSALRGYEIYADTTIQYTSALDSNPLTLVTVAKEQIHKGLTNRVTLTFSVNMRARETRPNKPCHKEISPSVCMAKCTKTFLVEKCDCVPFSFKKGLKISNGSNLTYCTEWHYAACKPLDYKSFLDQECVGKCKAACEYWSYNWQIKSELTTEGGEEGSLTFEVVMDPMANPFAEFVWTDKNTVEQFISQAGGLVNFYLGFDGLGIFAFIVTMIEMGKWYRRMKTLKAQRQQETPSVSTWNWSRRPSIAIGGGGLEKPASGDGGGRQQPTIGGGHFDELASSATERRIMEEVDRRMAVLRNELITEMQQERKRRGSYLNVGFQ